MAGSKSRTFEVNILKLILNNVPIANLGNTGGVLASTVAGNLYMRLHNTALVDDTTVGTQASYAGYVAGGIAIPRSVVGWTINDVSGYAENASEIKFGKCTSGTETIKYFSIWMDGTTQTLSHRLWHGMFSTDILITTNSEPIFPASYFTINED